MIIITNIDTGTFDIKNCDVHVHVSSDQHTSSILVECTFAINSTAPGIVVIQDDQSQYTINKTLQRLLQDSDKGSVNITDLHVPAGEYSVRVYDSLEDKKFAFFILLKIIISTPIPSNTPPTTHILYSGKLTWLILLCD